VIGNADDVAGNRFLDQLAFAGEEEDWILAAAIAGEDPALIGPLMESLEHDLLPRAEHDAAAAFGVHLHAFDAAVERALRDWERTEELAGR
jgi:hypothetical protein